MTQQRNIYGNTRLEEEESTLETLIGNGRATTIEIARFQEVQRIIARAELAKVDGAKAFQLCSDNQVNVMLINQRALVELTGDDAAAVRVAEIEGEQARRAEVARLTKSQAFWRRMQQPHPFRGDDR